VEAGCGFGVRIEWLADAAIPDRGALVSSPISADSPIPVCPSMGLYTSYGRRNWGVNSRNQVLNELIAVEVGKFAAARSL
jgi:hypothetical protein